jgi:hypothetical protein
MFFFHTKGWSTNVFTFLQGMEKTFRGRFQPSIVVDCLLCHKCKKTCCNRKWKWFNYSETNQIRNVPTLKPSTYF